ncbi:MAG: TIGR04338 family metallohydrolase [Gordonia sp. (in: high G+C Gram-positive bacteria)]|uniref:TIGR04338 family metallohydrolase n=1 Tax=Gordonia sp. (in: high G+C Gram-positive bacteria) TaxID=84139 RepID=UPI003BB679CA
MTRDSKRSAFYAAERMVYRLMERPGPSAHTVELAGARLTLPAEAKFASVDSVQRYVDRVLALSGVVEHFDRAQIPVTVRDRRSASAAHYNSAKAEIAVPATEENRWAMRELVVLHEVAHHLDPAVHADPPGAVHGPGFVHTLIELVGAVLGPETALVYRVILGEAGLT